MTGADQWDHGFARGMTAARNLTRRELEIAVATCRSLAAQYPYAKGFIAGAAEALRLDTDTRSRTCRPN